MSRFEREQERNREVLNDPAFAVDLDRRWLEVLLARFDAALAACRGLLEQRVTGGRIVEGHGDLRPEHVCLTDPPVVIDCLEFSEELRTMDPVDEIVFLGLECEALGAPWVQDVLMAEMVRRSSDRPPVAVMSFYRAYRAFLRARQSLAHLLVPVPREPAKWMPKARIYLRIAERALATPASPEVQPPSPLGAAGGSPRQTVEQR